MKKGRITGFFGAALTIAYAIYIVSYFSDASMDNVGGYLAATVVTPHMLCVAIAAVFSLVGVFARKRWAVLTSGILMAASAALFPMYAMFVVIQAILLFISYARSK